MNKEEIKIEEENYFVILNNINVQDKVEKKNGLSYLSWAWAWTEVKKKYPEANYTVYERYDDNFGNINYFTDGKTCWVKTGVTINDIEHIEELPIMDFKNKSIPYENITSFDVNKAIQRSLTKAVARHGLGLYIYAGEDLPEEEKEEKQNKSKKTTKTDVNYKQLLMDKLKELNLDVKEYAKEHKVNANTTQEEAKQLLEELNEFQKALIGDIPTEDVVK